MIRPKPNLLGLQLPTQQTRVGHFESIAHTQTEKFRQALINNAPFLLGIGVPVDDLMAKTLAAAANSIPNARGADANARGPDPRGG